jgi:hypothetical protein
MKVTCRQCGIEFDKEEKEVRRQRKEGRDYFFAVEIVLVLMRIK